MLAVASLRLSDYRLASARATLMLHRSVLELVFEAFVRANQAYLRTAPETPLLYSSGVVYRREPIEVWCDIPSAIRAGRDDCEGLSCWLAAELRERAPNSLGSARLPAARVVLRRQRSPGLWHAVVDLGGRIEDPSRRLGMRGGR
jgi:hypothetical protein